MHPSPPTRGFIHRFKGKLQEVFMTSISRASHQPAALCEFFFITTSSLLRIYELIVSEDEGFVKNFLPRDGVNLLSESIRQTTPVTCFRFDNCFYYIRFLLFLQSPYMIF